MNRYSREFSPIAEVRLGAILANDPKYPDLLRKALKRDDLSPRERYLFNRELAGFDEEETRAICQVQVPEASDYLFRSRCLLNDHTRSYTERKKIATEILEQAEQAEPETDLMVEVGFNLGFMASSQNDTFFAIKVLESAIQRTPSTVINDLSQLKSMVAFLYTSSPSNPPSMIRKGMQYFEENERLFRSMGSSIALDTVLWGQAITTLMALKDYPRSIELFAKIKTDDPDLQLDIDVFKAYALARLNRTQEALALVQDLSFSSYSDRSRIPFMRCYRDIVLYFSKKISDIPSCVILPPDTQRDVIEHITDELAPLELPEKTLLALHQQYFRYYKGKIEPILQQNIEQQSNDLELAQAKAESTIQRMIAEVQAQQLEAQRREQNLRLILAAAGLVTFSMAALLLLVRRHSRRIEEAEKARTLFFHNTSHELRTPLNGIIGFVDLVRQGTYGSLTTEAKHQLSKALGLADSLKTQVNTILDLAKSKRGELRITWQSIALNDLKDSADHLAEGLSLKSKDVTYESSIKAEDFTFIGDHEKMFTIIRNLLGNAFKFRDPTRPHHVTLAIRRDQQGLEIVVRDTGIGIHESYQKRIFEEFTQVDGHTRRAYEGTGLGLSMVRDLVHLLKGHIELTSELHRGSCFRVRIPEGKAEDVGTQGLSMTREPTHDISLGKLENQAMVVAPLDSSGRHFPHDFEIFVIDDNESNCEVICGLLQADGFHVRHTLSGQSGIDLMRQKPPHLLLLDMMMPQMSGGDVIAVMRDDPLLREVPIILITARASESDRIAGLGLGADDYLPKPIVAAELRLRVSNMLERHRLLRATERSIQEDKLLQIGELFSDLSHELKNIFQSSYGLRDLNMDDGMLSSGVLDIPDDLRFAYAKALISTDPIHFDLEKEKAFINSVKPKGQAFWISIARHLADTAIDQDQFLSLTHTLESSSEDVQNFVASQLTVFAQYRILLNSIVRSRDLSEGVLAYTRYHRFENICQLDTAWLQASKLLTCIKAHRLGSLEVDLKPLIVAIPESHLTQVLINLVMNAVQAMEVLPHHARWLRISCEVHVDSIDIVVQNAGEPIPPEVRAKLFQRGFSTKGENGSGIGLFVCRRLTVAVGGQLSYDSNASSPCFRIRLPQVDTKQKASA